jgi:hypothetical protein
MLEPFESPPQEDRVYEEDPYPRYVEVHDNLGESEIFGVGGKVIREQTPY